MSFLFYKRKLRQIKCKKEKLFFYLQNLSVLTFLELPLQKFDSASYIWHYSIEYIVINLDLELPIFKHWFYIYHCFAFLSPHTIRTKWLLWIHTIRKKWLLRLHTIRKKWLLWLHTIRKKWLRWLHAIRKNPPFQAFLVSKTYTCKKKPCTKLSVR